MSKSLEALEKISYRYVNALQFQEWCSTIRQDLERLEKLEKENQELIVNKNVAQAVAFDQKREIGELKDKIAELKEDGEEWQSAYEWSQAKNAILKLENQELETTLLEYKAQENLYWNTATNNVNLREENEKLKKAIEISKNKIGFLFHIDKDNNYYFSSKYLCNELTQEEFDLLKEVFSNDRT